MIILSVFGNSIDKISELFHRFICMKIKFRKNTAESIPRPAVLRLSQLYGMLEEAASRGDVSISSRQIGERLGVEPHNVRKDISHIGEVGTSGSGYDIGKLKTHIGTRFGFGRSRKACIAGLGSIGAALLNAGFHFMREYSIVAGFDSSINRLETIKTEVPVYPSREIAEVVRRSGIELAVITVPAQEAPEIARRLVDGGIRGIVNFTPAVLDTPEGVFVSTIDLASEFRYLSALITMSSD